MISSLDQKLHLTMSKLKLITWHDQYSKNCDKEKWVFSDYVIVFDGADIWNFGKDYTWNVGPVGVNIFLQFFHCQVQVHNNTQNI